MADLSFFQEEFDRHATNGALGDPNGVPGYAYLRVSTSGQAEEGRSGLPRQITRVHEVSAKSGICIPWDLVFADDHTGFQFVDRPELSKLRSEYTRPDRRADKVVIEYLDRLSRNADWHQGFLLDEMKQNHIETLFWKGFTSRVERAVMGAVSQDGMERSLEIMREGTLDKARSGRVTSKRAAYGYMFVDAEGKPSPKAKQETYYAPHPEQAEIIQLIYYKVGVEGMGTRPLCRYLEERFPPPGKYEYWQTSLISSLIRNPLYKGEFYANRVQRVLIPAKYQRPGEPVRMAQRDVERPRDEWILVPVPPIVNVDLWDAANAMLDKHSQMSPRNAKSQYLLKGLLKCDECGYSYAGRRSRRPHGWYRLYACYGRFGLVDKKKQDVNCAQCQIAADTLENAVWTALNHMVMHPERLIENIDAQLEDDENAGLKKQIAFLKRQLVDSKQEDEKLYRAFIADIFDEQEYAARRKLLKEKVVTLEKELEWISSRVLTLEEIEDDKAQILKFASKVREMGLTMDAPFAFKQRLVKLLVDKITLNAKEGWFCIEGQISGVWSIDEPGVRLDDLTLNESIGNTSACRRLKGHGHR